MIHLLFIGPLSASGLRQFERLKNLYHPRDHVEWKPDYPAGLELMKQMATSGFPVVTFCMLNKQKNLFGVLHPLQMCTEYLSKGNLKFYLIDSYRMSHADEEAVYRCNVTEILKDPLSEKQLDFKLEICRKALNGFEKKTADSARYFEEVNWEQEGEIEKVGSCFVVKMSGPKEDHGKWELKQGTVNEWQYQPKFETSAPKWTYCGEKPRFENGTWVFKGLEPSLFVENRDARVPKFFEKNKNLFFNTNKKINDALYQIDQRPKSSKEMTAREQEVEDLLFRLKSFVGQEKRGQVKSNLHDLKSLLLHLKNENFQLLKGTVDSIKMWDLVGYFNEQRFKELQHERNPDLVVKESSPWNQMLYRNENFKLIDSDGLVESMCRESGQRRQRLTLWSKKLKNIFNFKIKNYKQFEKSFFVRLDQEHMKLMKGKQTTEADFFVSFDTSRGKVFYHLGNFKPASILSTFRIPVKGSLYSLQRRDLPRLDVSKKELYLQSDPNNNLRELRKSLSYRIQNISTTGLMFFVNSSESKKYYPGQTVNPLTLNEEDLRFSAKVRIAWIKTIEDENGLEICAVGAEFIELDHASKVNIECYIYENIFYYANVA